MSYCKLEAPYPEPANGQKRIIFPVDPTGDLKEEILNYRIQLIPGRTLTLTRNEALNIRAFPGTIEECTVDGWGFEYYNVDLSSTAVATKMMLTSDGDDGEQQVKKFVPIAEPKLVRYNSAAPMVVYIPEDVELRYSVWTAGNEAVSQVE